MIRYRQKDSKWRFIRKRKILAHELPEYNSWIAMRSRCYNPKNTVYKRYGAKNIKVCERWNKSFEAFYADMGDKPSLDHSIDRIDRFGDYTPSNCRWATRSEQQSNTCRNVLIEYKGVQKTLAQWSRELKMYPDTLKRRLRSWPLENIFIGYENPARI